MKILLSILFVVLAILPFTSQAAVSCQNVYKPLQRPYKAVLRTAHDLSGLPRMIRHGQADKALNILQRRLDQDNPQVAEYMGKAYLSLEQFESALTEFKRLEALAPGDAKPIILQSIVYNRVQDWGASLDASHRIIAIDGITIESLRGVLRPLIQKQSFLEAQQAIDLLKKKFPDYRQVSVLESNLYVAQGQDNLAKRVLMEYLSQPESSKDIRAWGLLADIQIRLGLRSDAIQSYKQVVYHKDKSRIGHAQLAFLYMLEKQYDIALVYLDKVLSLSPRNRIATWNKAQILLLQERTDELAQLLSESRDPRLRPLIKASLELSRGHYEKALFSLKRGNSSVVNRLRAQAYFHLNKQELAYSELIQVIKKEPQPDIYIVSAVSFLENQRNRSQNANYSPILTAVLKSMSSREAAEVNKDNAILFWMHEAKAMSSLPSDVSSNIWLESTQGVKTIESTQSF